MQTGNKRPQNSSGGGEVSSEFDMTEATPKNFEGFFKARKKPIVIDTLKVNLPEGFKVKTLEGVMKGKQGDYLLIGVNGEKYPCDKAIFEKTYDILKDEKVEK